MRQRKKLIAKGVLGTVELMHFFDNISMLQITEGNKLTIKVFNHDVSDNTWSVSLFARDEHRGGVIEVLSGLLDRWLDKFYIEPFDNET